jgi:hypothetical protein
MSSDLCGTSAVGNSLGIQEVAHVIDTLEVVQKSVQIIVGAHRCLNMPSEGIGYNTEQVAMADRVINQIKEGISYINLAVDIMAHVSHCGSIPVDRASLHALQNSVMSSDLSHISSSMLSRLNGPLDCSILNNNKVDPVCLKLDQDLKKMSLILRQAEVVLTHLKATELQIQSKIGDSFVSSQIQACNLMVKRGLNYIDQFKIHLSAAYKILLETTRI